MIIRLFPLPEAESGQLSRRHQQHRQGVGHILRRAAVGDEQIVDGVEGDSRTQEAAGACDLQPRPLPCVCKSAAHDQAAEDVHRSRAEAPEENEGEAVRTVLDEIYAFVDAGAPQRGQGQTVKRGERLSQNYFSGITSKSKGIRTLFFQLSSYAFSNCFGCIGKPPMHRAAEFFRAAGHIFSFQIHPKKSNILKYEFQL